MREERREANALVVITAFGVVIGLLAGLFVGANVSPDVHKILWLAASLVLLMSVVTGILVYRRPSALPEEAAEPVSIDS